jgi:competence ComEA-like helix-hairpin-helix protein
MSESSSKVNINTDSLTKLKKIEGVGEKTAQEIINSRPFCSLEDLLNVKGIGEITLKKIKEQGIAFVEPNFCQNSSEEKTYLEESKNKNISSLSVEESDNTKKESIINLSSNKKEAKEEKRPKTLRELLSEI